MITRISHGGSRCLPVSDRLANAPEPSSTERPVWPVEPASVHCIIRTGGPDKPSEHDRRAHQVHGHDRSGQGNEPEADRGHRPDGHGLVTGQGRFADAGGRRSGVVNVGVGRIPPLLGSTAVSQLEHLLGARLPESTGTDAVAGQPSGDRQAVRPKDDPARSSQRTIGAAGTREQTRMSRNAHERHASFLGCAAAASSCSSTIGSSVFVALMWRPRVSSTAGLNVAQARGCLRI
jgi:hypothetical protein